MHVSNFAEIKDWCVGYHGTKTDSPWYPPGNWLPSLPHSSEQPHPAYEPNVPSVVHDNAGLRASHDPPRASSLEPIHVQTEIDMHSFCLTDSEQPAHQAVKRVRWADTSDETTCCDWLRETCASVYDSFQNQLHWGTAVGRRAGPFRGDSAGAAGGVRFEWTAVGRRWQGILGCY